MHMYPQSREIIQVKIGKWSSWKANSYAMTCYKYYIYFYILQKNAIIIMKIRFPQKVDIKREHFLIQCIMLFGILISLFIIISYANMKVFYKKNSIKPL